MKIKIKNGLIIAVATSFLALAGCATDHSLCSWLHHEQAAPVMNKDQAIEDYHNAKTSRHHSFRN